MDLEGINIKLKERYESQSCEVVALDSPVHTGDHKEHPRPPGTPCHQPAQPEDDGPLELLDDLHHQDEGEGEGDQHQHQRDEGEQPGADHGAASLAVWGFVRYNMCVRYMSRLCDKVASNTLKCSIV